MTFGRSHRPDDWPTVHDRARAALSDQMDGALDVTEAGWLDTHLAGCADCRQTADEYAAQRFELRALRDRQPLPPRDLWARTAAAIELEASGRSTGSRGFSRRLLLAPSAFIATALAVAVVSGLLTSSRLPVHDGGGGSSPVVAAASHATSSAPEVAVGPTPIPVRRSVEFVAPDASGNLTFNVKTVDQVCPKGSKDPCDTSAPVEEHSVAIAQDAQAVYGSEDQKRLIVTTEDNGSVSVVALADEPVVPSSAPSESPSTASSSPTDTASPTGTPSIEPSSAPPSTLATASPSPTVTASPTGSIEVTPPGAGNTVEIANGVVLVGQTAAYSESGDWFAFTARPIDGSAGPDIYVWRVGTPSARRITDGGHSVFGSWVGDELVGSTAVDPVTGSSDNGKPSLRPSAFLLDPSSGTQVAVPQAGSAWRPVVGPKEHRRAVYWTGTVRAVDGPGFAPESGRLVLGDWTVTRPTASGAPAATPLTGDQGKERHETTIGAGRVDDWDAAWDPTGTHLAVWIADHQDPDLGRLSLYSVSSFDGSIDVKSPLLDSQIALAGFAISDGQLIWAQPSKDGSAGKGSLQLLAWTADAIGTVETYEGPAIVIR